MSSYSSQARHWSTTFGEWIALYKTKQGDAPRRRAMAIIGSAQQAEAEVQRLSGSELRDLDVLDIGTGQLLGHLAYFARHNRAVGIDLDIIPQGSNPLQYLKMWRVNGFRRTAKTLARKMMGFDRRFRREMMDQLGMTCWPRLKVQLMSADRMSFASNSFDVVYSFEVFEHILEPARAVDEIVRVLRPGGIAYLGFQLFTGATGALDYAGSRKGRGQRVWWPHLRPQFMGQIDYQSALNKLRLPQWRALFDNRMPMNRLTVSRGADPEIERQARRLLSAGELKEYSLEELTADGLTVVWRKP